MRALLTPEVVPRLGVVLFKPGKDQAHNGVAKCKSYDHPY